MEGIYEVYSAGQAVGKVTVSRQGLYYRFNCRCTLTGEVMFRLVLEDGNNRYDLGILTPVDGFFGLQCRRTLKQMECTAPRFILRPNRKSYGAELISVKPQEPFAYLSALENAFLLRRNGKNWIGLQDEK